MTSDSFESLSYEELEDLIGPHYETKLSSQSQKVSKSHNKVIHYMIHSIYYFLTPTLTD
jgi:hypothetical protein